MKYFILGLLTTLALCQSPTFTSVVKSASSANDYRVEKFKDGNVLCYVLLAYYDRSVSISCIKVQ